MWEGVERSRLGCVGVEAGCRLPRTIRTTKFHPALAVRPVVTCRDARSFLVSLRRAAVNRAPCWSWRRAGWSWRWGVWRDTQDHRAQVAKYPRYSVDQLDSRTLHCNQSGYLSESHFRLESYKSRSHHWSARTTVTILNTTRIPIALRINLFDF